jgi:hypothetical protein
LVVGAQANGFNLKSHFPVVMPTLIIASHVKPEILTAVFLY